MGKSSTRFGCVSGFLMICGMVLVAMVAYAIMLRKPSRDPSTSPDNSQNLPEPEKLSDDVVFFPPGPESLIALRRRDVGESAELRSGPGEEHPKVVNQHASDHFKEIHYALIDSSCTVEVLQTEGDWVEIQVTQPEHLKDSHRGWVPKSVIKEGAATDKLDGWIRQTCHVYREPNYASQPAGYLKPPSAVSVADDGSGWLRLFHGPVRDKKTNEFLDIGFDPGLYIEKSNFTTELPMNWEKR